MKQNRVMRILKANQMFEQTCLKNLKRFHVMTLFDLNQADKISIKINIIVRRESH